MKVKICGIRTEEDVKTVVSAGPDMAGFLVGRKHPSPDFITAAAASRYMRMVPPGIQCFSVTHLTDPDEIIDLVVQTGNVNIQLHGGSTPEQTEQLKSMLPSSAKLVLAVHLKDEADFIRYCPFFKTVSAFLVDSYDAATGRVGGTGIPADWSLAAKFVQFSPLPVILAGGLTPENVEQAAEIVRPYGVDVNTGVKNKDRSISHERCVSFIRSAGRTGGLR